MAFDLSIYGIRFGFQSGHWQSKFKWTFWWTSIWTSIWTFWHPSEHKDKSAKRTLKWTFGRIQLSDKNSVVLHSLSISNLGLFFLLHPLKRLDYSDLSNPVTHWQWTTQTKWECLNHLIHQQTINDSPDKLVFSRFEVWLSLGSLISLFHHLIIGLLEFDSNASNCPTSLLNKATRIGCSMRCLWKSTVWNRSLLPPFTQNSRRIEVWVAVVVSTVASVAVGSVLVASGGRIEVDNALVKQLSNSELNASPTIEIELTIQWTAFSLLSQFQRVIHLLISLNDFHRMNAIDSTVYWLCIDLVEYDWVNRCCQTLHIVYRCSSVEWVEI